MRALVVLAVGIVSANLCSCLSFNWQRTFDQLPIEPEVIARLPEQGAGLQDCLELLGAPVLVREHQVHGLVIAYGWESDRALGATLSIPVTRSNSASFSFTDNRFRTKGLVLWFDENWKLADWREGYLGQLIGEQPPPATLEEIERG